MEPVRRRIGWMLIDLAADQFVAITARALKEVLVERASQSSAACSGVHHDAVYVDEARNSIPKPAEIRAVIKSVLVERDQKR